MFAHCQLFSGFHPQMSWFLLSQKRASCKNKRPQKMASARARQLVFYLQIEVQGHLRCRNPRDPVTPLWGLEQQPGELRSYKATGKTTHSHFALAERVALLRPVGRRYAPVNQLGAHPVYPFEHFVCGICFHVHHAWRCYCGRTKSTKLHSWDLWFINQYSNRASSISTSAHTSEFSGDFPLWWLLKGNPKTCGSCPFKSQCPKMLGLPAILTGQGQMGGHLGERPGPRPRGCGHPVEGADSRILGLQLVNGGGVEKWA